MKNEEEDASKLVNKVYYDVNIRYDPKNVNPPLNYYSPAKTEIKLNAAIIDNTEDYDLVISKLRIDTECIPIFIPEMKQPIPDTKLKSDVQETNYVVYAFDPNAKKDNRFFGEYITIHCNRENGVARSDAGFSIRKIDNKHYINNLDESCYFYDYQSFIKYINSAIDRVLYKIPNGQKLKNYPAAFFKQEDDKLRFYFTESLFDSGIVLGFSGNLYKLIGNGFPTKHADMDNIPTEWKDKGVWTMVINDDYSHTTKVREKYIYDVKSAIGPFEHRILTAADGVITGDNIRYYYYNQQYSTLTEWNICSALLICSEDFPIKGEYYPVCPKNGFLTHYNEDWYTEVLKKIGNPDGDEKPAIYNRNTMKIIDVFYPQTLTPGDIRTYFVYNNENIETGNKIDMVSGTPINHFTVSIKWVDIYGNLHDLNLAPGRSCNIRFCFTRKKIKKEELINAFTAVMEALTPQEEEKSVSEYTDENDPFQLRERPPKKRNRVDAKGYTPTGLLVT